MGQLVIVDPSVGWEESRGIVQRISGQGDPIEPKIRDALVNGDWPMFLHPFSTQRHIFPCQLLEGPQGLLGDLPRRRLRQFGLDT